MNTQWSPFRAYCKTKRWPWQDFCLLAIFCLIGCWLWLRARHLPEYDWNWDLLARFIALKGKSGAWEAGLLIKGLFTTFRIGVWTAIFALTLGVFLSFLQTRGKILAILCHIYVNIIRNTPPLVFLFCVYLFAGQILPVATIEDGIRHLPPFFGDLVVDLFAGPGQMDRMLAAVIALGLYQGAFVAEIIRGGLQSVNPGQWDAARALGFSSWQTLRLVIYPQAARLMLPPLVGQIITIFKDSALASLISLPDLTFQSLEIMAVSGMTFEIWISAAILYLLLGGVCALFGKWLEKKYSFHTI